LLPLSMRWRADAPALPDSDRPHAGRRIVLVTRSSPARPDEIRQHNLGRVLEQVHLKGEQSRADLTQSLGLNRSTIRALVADLTERRLVREAVPVGSNRTGRPSFLVAPRSDGPYVIAAEVDVDYLTTAAVGLGGTVLARNQHELTPGTTTPELAAQVIAADIDALPERVPDGAWLVGAGISIPGTVRPDGWVDHAPNLHWRDQPFGAVVSAVVPSWVPLRYGNDANLGALAEHLRGAAKGRSHCVYVNGKVGVGGGVIADSVQLTGAGGFAGEIGHMVLDPAGPLCSCGSNGCLETLVGEEALLRLAGRPGPVSREAVTEVLTAARLGEAEALSAVRTVAHWLGLGVSNLINLLNPEVVIIGGSLGGVFSLARDVVDGEVTRHSMGSALRMSVLRTPQLGEDSSLLGAAELAIGPMLAEPLAFPPGYPESRPVASDPRGLVASRVAATSAAVPGSITASTTTG
jgi:predicted NBD/HSP70 family sugar kinase